MLIHKRGWSTFGSFYTRRSSTVLCRACPSSMIRRLYAALHRLKMTMRRKAKPRRWCWWTTGRSGWGWWSIACWTKSVTRGWRRRCCSRSVLRHSARCLWLRAADAQCDLLALYSQPRRLSPVTEVGRRKWRESPLCRDRNKNDAAGWLVQGTTTTQTPHLATTTTK